MKLTYRYILTATGHCIKVSPCDYDQLIQYGWYINQHTDREDNNYAEASIKGKRVKMHRLVLSLSDSTLFVDHINGDTFDNRRENLRLATRQENGANRKLHSNNRTGKTGISFDQRTGKYMACIKINGKTIHLGRFTSFDAAISARKNAEVTYWGKEQRS